MSKKDIEIKKNNNLGKAIKLMVLIIKAYQKEIISKMEMEQYFSDLANIIKENKW
jgi:hypothetical protein